VSGTISLGAHFNPLALWPIHYEKKDTNHLLKHTSKLGNSRTQLQSILTVEMELTAITLQLSFGLYGKLSVGSSTTLHLVIYKHSKTI